MPRSVEGSWKHHLSCRLHVAVELFRALNVFSTSPISFASLREAAGSVAQLSRLAVPDQLGQPLVVPASATIARSVSLIQNTASSVL